MCLEAHRFSPLPSGPGHHHLWPGSEPEPAHWSHFHCTPLEALLSTAASVILLQRQMSQPQILQGFVPLPIQVKARWSTGYYRITPISPCFWPHRLPLFPLAHCSLATLAPGWSSDLPGTLWCEGLPTGSPGTVLPVRPLFGWPPPRPAPNQVLAQVSRLSYPVLNWT